ncbi:MAG TPA: LysM peptidoglycan-binding domain-containing protein [Luteimonas sp.]|nr:LysM peptidoglycan-binding domain-containing protein [Luteimonas sp.]
MTSPDTPGRPGGDEPTPAPGRARPGEPLGDPGAAITPGFARAQADAAAFSGVRSGVTSTETPAGGADFGAVRSSVSSTEQPTGERSYTVQSGDTLSHIAQAHYGRASQWSRIFEANRDQLDDADRIRPGQVLRIPADDPTGA